MIEITSNAIVKYMQIKYGLSISKIKGEIIKSNERKKYSNDFTGSIQEKDYVLVVKKGSIVTIQSDNNTEQENVLPYNLSNSKVRKEANNEC